MANALVPVVARAKIAKARKEGGKLAAIKYMAFGCGGIDSAGSVKIPTSDATALNNEILRKAYDSVNETSSCSYVYTCRLEENELKGKEISEIALIDADGDLASIQFFKPRPDDVEQIYEITDDYT